jgi:hypothetical protein
MTFFKHFIVAGTIGLAAVQAVAGLGRAPQVAQAGVDTNGAKPQVTAALKSVVPTPIPGGLYATHQLTLASGTVVTEYANSGNIVFAVSWAGPVLPDLTVLLGDYFPTFKAQTDRRRAAGLRGGPVQVAVDGLTVVSAGRMGHFSGYAYAASLVPTGVDVASVLKDAP